MPKFKYTKEQQDRLLERIFRGNVSLVRLPADLYHAIADRLKSGLYKGFRGGLTAFTYGKPDHLLLNELRTNIYAFSAAKTFQEVKEISGKLVKDGQIIPFNEFKKEADQIFDQYNKHWLRAEYRTAIGQARNARAWNKFEAQKETFQLLRYNAVSDDNICPICEPLDGITLPVDDPFWDNFMPENHFNCRCLVEQYTDEEARPTGDEKVFTAADEAVSQGLSEEFMMNPGKDGVVFKEAGPNKHPYFDVEPRYQSFAKENFGLPIPKDDDE